MVSENKTESVMLEGKSGYFKKSGSMTNLGVIDINNQNASTQIGPGFIDEGSTIQPAGLGTSSDYVSTVNDMKLYLGDDFVEETEDYQVKTNAENISNSLSTRDISINTMANMGNTYMDLPYIDNNKQPLNAIIPMHITPNFVFQIKSNLHSVCEEYTLIGNDTFKIWENTEGKFFINDAELPRIEHTKEIIMEIVQQDNYFIIKLGDNVVFENSAYFNEDMDINIDTRFTDYLYFIRLYNDSNITYDIMPKYDRILNETGLYNYTDNTWYSLPGIKPYTEYEYANIWSGALDLGYCPGPNTGLEFKFRMYSTPSTSTHTLRNLIGCFSQCSTSNVMTFGVLLGNGSKVYATRNNNVDNWVSSDIVGNTTATVVTLNKNGDGKFIGTGGMNFNKSMTGTATIQNKGNASLWLAGGNNMPGYINLDTVCTQTLIPWKTDYYIHYVKIYEGDELVRDYVCAKTLDGTSGMWDKIENKFYPKKKCSFNPSNAIN